MNRRTAISSLILLISACNSHTVIDRHQAIATEGLKENEAVVLLGRATRLAEQGDTDFVECVGQRIQSASEVSQVIREAEFADAMYPWFESSTAPSDISMLNDLFENESVAARFDTLAVRYLVWIEGRTETMDSRGGISCSVSPGGGGCFGFKSWDDEAEYTATVWDLEARADAGRIGTRTNGTSYLPAFVLPVPLLARVKSTACDAMAEQLSDHFVY